MSGRLAERTEIADVLADIKASTKLQQRTADGMAAVATALTRGKAIEAACAEAGVTRATFGNWRRTYPAYEELVRGLIRANESARRAADEVRKAERRKGQGLVLERRERPDRGGLREFRMRYFGRPTPKHHELVTDALEDATNLTVLIFGPTGMGKDTIAGDYVAWEVAPDETGKRVAWFMESKDFSERRMQRLARYLTDPSVYNHAPSKTPGGKKPAGSLIEDYGPFRWAPGMTHPDGSKVERPSWTNQTMYFVQVAAPESDPNLWATGIGGSTYGSRIDVAVVSDAFTVENQQQPAPRRAGLNFIYGTLDTRLDEAGRLVVIGTMLPIENNYEDMIEKYTEDARVVSERSDSHATYTKYSNGTAIVVVKAIAVDPETGEETSYWPQRFPLDDEYHYKGKVYKGADLTDERIMEIAEGGGRLRRGLRTRRARMPSMFKAMFQQERDVESGGDFTDATFEAARDPMRSFGIVYPHEVTVLCIDPAKRYGAAWALLAIDRREQKVTLADFYFGVNLGYTGIKQKLILEPLFRWSPLWLCYEPNQHGAVLDDTLIKEAIAESGVSLDTPHTGKNRNDPEIGVGSIGAYMRGHQFMIPSATAADRARFEVVKDHFKAFDSGPNRPKPGTPRHVPDDIALAVWVGFKRALLLMMGKASKNRGIRAPMPPGLRRKYERMLKQGKAGKADRHRADHVSAEQLLDAFVAE